MSGLSGADVALAAVFGIWIVLTVATQSKSRLRDGLRQSELFMLIPRWHFFAPNPGVHDFVLLFRDRASNGDVSPWCEAPKLAVSHPAAWVLWNPARRHTKGLIDVTNDLVELINSYGARQRQLLLSVPYLAILNYISNLPRLDPDCATQFAIAIAQSSASDQPPQVMFVSALHAIN